MFKFIRYFFIGWMDFPVFDAWKKALFTDAQLKEMKKTDAKRGIAPVNTRFEYALSTAKVHYRHRDRYGSKCTGDCEKCKAKHC